MPYVRSDADLQVVEQKRRMQTGALAAAASRASLAAFCLAVSGREAGIDEAPAFGW